MPYDTTYGGSACGGWEVDDQGLPAFRYEGSTNPDCPDPGDVVHLVGNGAVSALAHSDGFVELLTARTFYRVVNHHDEASRAFSGGFGWVRDGDRTWSTHFLDRPPASTVERHFGMGYVRRKTTFEGLSVEETVHAAPDEGEALIEQIRLVNDSSAPKDIRYFALWDVASWLLRFDSVVTRASAYDPSTVETEYDASAHALLARSTATPGDPEVPSLTTDPAPKTLFAVMDGAGPDRWDTLKSSFFGSGDRALPEAVRAGHLTGSVDGSGTLRNQDATFAMERSAHLGAGESVSFTITYGVADRGKEKDAIDAVRPDRAHPDPRAAFGDRIPRVEFPGSEWVTREMAWSTYYLLAGRLREDFFGARSVNQGSVYEYFWGANAGPRAAYRHVLPLIYIEPEAAREVFVYAFRSMKDTGELAYATSGYGGFQPFGLLPSDHSLWLLWAAAEYVNATRDRSLLTDSFDYFCEAGRGKCGAGT
ncbi:MAG: hypothetical protein FJ104_06765, partial [Deltaproteobacteria bacterium]|nr:hypothetical protein [Deltaproteobacteria bacterium]